MDKRLENLGLSPAEARTYLELLAHPDLSGQQIAEALDVSKSTAYGALKSLAEKGLVETGASYGSRYRPLPPEEALPSLIEGQRAILMDRETEAKELAEALADVASTNPKETDELVEVLRDPRVIADRYERLQSEAQRTIDGFIKAPVVASKRGNPSEIDALARGVRIRALYETAVLDHPHVRAHLEAWIDAGEEARLYAGNLPFKLALYDGRSALMPLETPGSKRGFTAILVRNAALGEGLQMLFDRLWQESSVLQEGSGRAGNSH